ncbi:pilus assembly protein PilM [Thermovorax subterraneus]|nr:pilus assembly protein PilM [Thermovorax subterraneus]
MGIFGFGSKSFLGVDIGTSRIKVVAVDKGRVMGKGSATIEENGADDFSKIKSALEMALEQVGVRVSEAALALGADKAVVRYVLLPKMPEKDLRAGLKYEASKYLPIADQNVVVDFTILEDNVEGEPGKIRVLLAALRRDLAEKYHELFKQTGLKLKAIDLVPLALCRLFRTLGERGNIIAMDIGENYSHVVLIELGKLAFSRAVNIGYKEMTRVAFPSGLNPAADLVQEIRRSLDFYRMQKKFDYIPEKLLICGGGGYISNIESILEEGLGISSEVVTPLGLGSEYAVAVGLALRER